MGRLTRDQYLTELVKLVSRRGTCKRAQVGALLVRDGRVICTGHNGSPPGEPHCLDVGCEMEDGHCIRTTHAETNVIAFAARNGISTDGCSIWVFGWDGGICHRCMKVLKAAGITEFIVVPVRESLYRVVNTDNFGGDYPEEKFVTETLTKSAAEQVAEDLNKTLSNYSPRYYKVVKEDYKLQPGFEA